MQTLMLCVFAETNIARVVTPMARKTLMLEEYRSDTLADLEFCSCLGTYLHDCSHRLMRGYEGQLGLVDSLIHLVIGVAEPGGPDLDEDVVISNFRDGYLVELERFAELTVLL
jgi:hypothetical protein